MKRQFQTLIGAAAGTSPISTLACGKVHRMKMHIEYDDFGEYVESLEDLMEAPDQATITGGISNMKKMVKKFLLTLAMLTVMLSTSSYASPGTCKVMRCHRCTTGGSAYCFVHKCRHYGCKNYGSDDGYCFNHAKKSSSSGKHKCRYSGCNNKADASGYCSKHHYKSSDPYGVYDYDDPEDFYYDWEDDFEDYEDAEDYWEEAWY